MNLKFQTFPLFVYFPLSSAISTRISIIIYVQTEYNFKTKPNRQILKENKQQVKNRAPNSVSRSKFTLDAAASLHSKCKTCTVGKKSMTLRDSIRLSNNI